MGEIRIKPAHPWQDWEKFGTSEYDVPELMDYTYQEEWHAVYTIQLGELVSSGVFDWSRTELDWSESAYSQEQYDELCAYFIERFRFREISITPPLEWMYALKRMLMYELMPKYKPLYEQMENGISPLGENDYYKERHVSSAYPETLLSGNSDYISSGEDKETERIKIENVGEALQNYKSTFESANKAICDELEVLFVSMYTSYSNGL